MGVLAIAYLSLVPLAVGFGLLLSDSKRYEPNDWRGLLHSRRFWGGLALFLVGTAMILYPFYYAGGLF